MILGIETSCDETAAALVTEDGRVLSNVVSSQAELHAPYGGVVPEVASRHHLELLLPAVQTALDEADATLDDVQRGRRDPASSALCSSGVSSAKALAWSRRLPLAPVNHLHGHVASLFLAVDGVSDTRHGSGDRSSRRFSACSRVAVTLCCWMREITRRSRCSARRSTTRRARPLTRRAAARARLSGRRSDRQAREGRQSRGILFPVAHVPGLDFSFSGLKTALLYRVRDLGEEEPSGVAPRRRRASYQRAIVRTRSSSGRGRRRRRSAPSGSRSSAVSPRTRARAALLDAAQAPLELCTDNAAMIASPHGSWSRLPTLSTLRSTPPLDGSPSLVLAIVALAAAAISVAAATRRLARGCTGRSGLHGAGLSAGLITRCPSGSE